MIPVLSPVPTSYSFVPVGKAAKFWQFLRKHKIEEVLKSKGFHCSVTILKTKEEVDEAWILLGLHGVKRDAGKFQLELNDLKIKVWKIDSKVDDTVESVALEVMHAFDSEDATPLRIKELVGL